ncbi:hypothetical protein QZH56_36905 (plasmid) [Streptomyces olivoreticuli]|uniref:hypothetical protein n=1 Tax=Streptomyces olivoreticuli TaxID=68246 RepID=UPI0026581625|nr:hypothetical protein [Streptomyces olivoreticuli]WKK27834.1 hypothetical protein QZH56_36905 [Streptomyces olivoreticuli]
MTSASQLAAPLTPDELVKVFEKLGVRMSIGPDSGTKEELTLNLAHGLVGAVENHAIRAEHAAREKGAGPEVIGEATGQAFNGAACRGVADDLFLLSWRAQRLTQAIGQVNEHNSPDKLMKAVQMTAGALMGLLQAAHTMRDMQRDERATKDAARCVRAADKALEQARAEGGLKVLADLLTMTD